MASCRIGKSKQNHLILNQLAIASRMIQGQLALNQMVAWQRITSGEFSAA